MLCQSLDRHVCQFMDFSHRLGLDHKIAIDPEQDQNPGNNSDKTEADLLLDAVFPGLPGCLLYIHERHENGTKEERFLTNPLLCLENREIIQSTV